MLTLAVALLLQVPTSWPIGVEREVDEGVYMQVVAVEQGWRVWRVETREGVKCRAVKSGTGQRHPIPVGVGSALFGGTPFLTISPAAGGGSFDYSWRARYSGRARVKYRLGGERFWEESGALGFDPTLIREREVEVVVTSWEYPDILVGYSEETATLDLAGIGWAETETLRCEGRAV